MIRQFHEAPMCMFDEVQKVTDGDYALVHLFEDHPEYFEKFKKALAKNRPVILDNSIFELGEAFNGDRFAKWIQALKPTWYVVPDYWKNGPETVRMFFDFIRKHPDLPGMRMGVAQGNTAAEVADTYCKLEPYCDMIAFNFDFSTVFYDAYWDQLREYVPVRLAMSLGRHMVISELAARGVINPNKKHHLLGCGVPQEVQWYNPHWQWLFSIDTCHPVTAGIEGWAYTPKGLDFKSPMKVHEILDDKFNTYQLDLVLKNIQMMKGWCRL